MALLAQPHRRFHGVLVERVHRQAHIVGFNAGAVGPHADADIVIEDAFDGDEDLHE